MPAAIRSMFTASVALASAGVIAASPLAPTPELPMPTVHIPSINLVNGSSVPALGAIPYQILVNLLGNALAAAPILLGGIEQCTVCVGPVSPPSPAASPFTGWGTLGVGVGLLTSPFAIIGAVQAGQSILQALGVGLLAIQTPIINTATLIQAPRQPFGGYEFGATRARAAQAVVDAVVGAFESPERSSPGCAPSSPDPWPGSPRSPRPWRPRATSSRRSTPDWRRSPPASRPPWQTPSARFRACARSSTPTSPVGRGRPPPDPDRRRSAYCDPGGSNRGRSNRGRSNSGRSNSGRSNSGRSNSGRNDCSGCGVGADSGDH